MQPGKEGGMEPRAVALLPHTQPYETQRAFCRGLFASLREGAVAVMESPTGTGKTASLLACAISWALGDDSALASMPAWVRAAKEHVAAGSSSVPIIPAAKRPKAEKQTTSKLHLDAELCRLLGIAERMGRASTESAGLPRPTARRVYYCSRTHSQLAQVVAEARRIVAQSADARVRRLRIVPLASRAHMCTNPRVREAPSGAVNEACAALLEDDACAAYHAADSLAVRLAAEKTIVDVEDVVSAGTAHGGCPYYASRALAVASADIVVLPHAAVLDRRTRAALGVSLSGALVVIDEAHNVSSALSSAESVELRLDAAQAAHEALTAHLHRHGGRMGPEQRVLVSLLVKAIGALVQFATSTHLDRGDGSQRWKVLGSAEVLRACGLYGENVLRVQSFAEDIRQAVRISRDASTRASILSAARLIAGLGASQRVLLVKCDALESQAFFTSTETTSFASGIAVGVEAKGMHVKTALAATDLRNASTNITLKLVALDTQEAMDTICDEAAAVVLAGGTMSPADDVLAALFGARGSPGARSVRHVVCDHVVPPERILARVLGASPCGKRLRLTHGAFSDPSVLSAILVVLRNACRAVCEGVVVFLPSYASLDSLEAHIRIHGAALAGHSRLFFERRGDDSVFAAYCAAVNSFVAERSSTESALPKELSNAEFHEAVLDRSSVKHSQEKMDGAILFSVMGGRLSEGVNFADDLARLLVVVGMPYGNIADPETRVRAEHAAGTSFASAKHPAQTSARSTENVQHENGVSEARMYAHLENTCMRVVGQTVGRAVRHANDRAAILLLDERYGDQRVAAKLPAWMRRSLPGTGCSSFGSVMRDLGRFSQTFSTHRD